MIGPLWGELRLYEKEILGHQTLDPDPESGSAIRKNAGSGSVSGSALNQCGSKTLGITVFWLKLFLGAFFTKVICTFLKSVPTKRWIFDAPFDLFKEKSFHLLDGKMDLFENIEDQNWKKPLNISKNGFYKQTFDFHCPSKIL